MLRADWLPLRWLLRDNKLKVFFFQNGRKPFVEVTDEEMNCFKELAYTETIIHLRLGE